MGNMSYCRFRNTLQDLQDCKENLFDQDMSREEFNARESLIALCKDIADEMTGEDIEDYEDFYEPYDEEPE